MRTRVNVQPCTLPPTSTTTEQVREQTLAATTLPSSTLQQQPKSQHQTQRFGTDCETMLISKGVEKSEEQLLKTESAQPFQFSNVWHITRTSEFPDCIWDLSIV